MTAGFDWNASRRILLIDAARRWVRWLDDALPPRMRSSPLPCAARWTARHASGSVRFERSPRREAIPGLPRTGAGLDVVPARSALLPRSRVKIGPLTPRRGSSVNDTPN